MPEADTKEWADPVKIAQLVHSWAIGVNRPLNGSFAKLNYKNGTIIPNYL